jgi:hypothetical protein
MNDYTQLLSLITGGQQTPADIQPGTQGPNWLQWLLQNKQQAGGGGGGGTGGMSGLGTALFKLAGGGAAAGGAAGGMGMLGAL